MTGRLGAQVRTLWTHAEVRGSRAGAAAVGRNGHLCCGRTQPEPRCVHALDRRPTGVPGSQEQPSQGWRRQEDVQVSATGSSSWRSARERTSCIRLYFLTTSSSARRGRRTSGSWAASVAMTASRSSGSWVANWPRGPCSGCQSSWG